MKCKYQFAVHGPIRLAVNAPIESRGWTVEFGTVDGMVTHVSVTVPLKDADQWPTVTKNPSPGIKARVDVNTPHLSFVQREIRALQGLLALYGLRSIDVNHPKFEWIPESEDEKRNLQLLRFEIRQQKPPDEELSPLSFDILARAVFASDAATDSDVPFSFFRRGMSDVAEQNYIEAFYDFFSVLETMFADGKFKSVAVLEAFRRSTQLRSAVQEALTNPNPVDDEKLTKEYQAVYGQLTIDEALARIVELRGFLHHHAKRRRDTWHPDDQERFACDALFMQEVAFNVVWSLAQSYLYADEVIKASEELHTRLSDHGALRQNN